MSRYNEAMDRETYDAPVTLQNVEIFSSSCLSAADLVFEDLDCINAQSVMQ